MNARTFALLDAETGKQVGSIILDRPLPPGEIVVRFRRNEFLVEPLPDKPFSGRGGVHDHRAGKKPA